MAHFWPERFLVHLQTLTVPEKYLVSSADNPVSGI
jgi:hypothetical protein